MLFFDKNKMKYLKNKQFLATIICNYFITVLAVLARRCPWKKM